MRLFSNKKPLCEVHICSNFLPENPAYIVMDEHQFRVCDECYKLMEVITEKYEEMEDEDYEQPL